MKDIIQQIMNQENLDEIYGYAQNALFKDGPVSITTLEILSYLKLFAPDYFSAVEEEILSIMGIFYKKPTARTLQSKLFELYSEHIRQTYHHDYTPVQANILKQIQANQHFSFSAPTSTGKSHVFRHLIETSKRDVAIIVPSRALINEYYDRICELISDKSVNILTFVDIINTRHSNRTVFILTPERAKELFKHKDKLDLEFVLFDEAQLSDEDSTRGLFFDSIVRRIQSNFPETKCVFAHPFVSNPEAQLQKNNFDIDDSKAFCYAQKCVGQIFFAHDGTSYFHFGLDTDTMGKRKIRSDFDPVLRAIRTGGSVLIYTTKASISLKTVFNKFKLYIDECRSLTDPQALQLIDQFKKCIGANDKDEGYYASSMLEYMRKGIVVHHGSLPLQARLILEHFTQRGFCRICFATSTLEQGINMPFDVVYLNTFQASRTLSMKNLIGRAGRSTTRSRFDYGSVVIKAENMSAFRAIMLNDEVLSSTSLLDSADDEDSELHDFKEAINSGTYSDEYNLTDSEVQRLSDTNIDMLVKTALDSLFEGEYLISLAKINADYDSKLHLYESLCDLYRYYLNGRTLSEGEESVLNTAIKILLWKIHCKTFKAICWYRYAYVARIPERRAFAKKYRAAKSQNERQRIRAAAVALPAKFIRGYDDIPNKSLPNYSIYKRGTKAPDVDYDRIVFDTYDYLDKLISFKLSDIFYAIFSEYYKRTNDIRALKMAQYFKYGTDNENEIWMLRYGLSFEDIEILKPYIVSIGQEEIVFSADIQNLSPEQIKPVKRYL